MIKKFHSNQARLRRHQRMRNHLEGSQARPRLNIFRSGQHIYAQIIDDTTGNTLVAASSLDESLRSFKPAQEQKSSSSGIGQVEVEQEPEVEVANAAPTQKGGSKAASSKNASQKANNRPSAAKTGLPAAQKKAPKTPVEALAAIANNRKVAVSREVGKLIAQRAKEQGLSQVVFDRGGYAYHGRIAALAEGAREAGLDF